MAIISIFSGPFCHGEAVADAAAERMGYRRIDKDLMTRASEMSGVSEDKLNAAMKSEPGLFERFKHDRDKQIGYIRLALAELVQDDNLVLYGYTTQLLPWSLNHVLRVCLIANNDYRIKVAAESSGISERQATELMRRGDRSRSQWTQHVAGRLPYEARNYDLMLPMHELSPDDAAGEILLNAGKDAIRTTDESRSAARDFLLAAQVNLVLAEKGHPVSVTAEDGHVTITINKYTNRLDALQRQLEKLARGVEGVRSAKSVPGTGFVPPSLMPQPDLPSKVLLVDDEREFVHSLSERLETRHFDSSVVYDGEQALEAIEEEEPEVMVLDLKMPGIDGIEVLRRVKQKHPAVEVIILTGHGSDREEKLAMELGAFAYLTKPVNIDVLADTMKQAYSKIGRVEEDLDSNA